MTNVPPIPVRLARPDQGATSDQLLWMLVRNRTDAISFNNFDRFANSVFTGNPRRRPRTSPRSPTSRTERGHSSWARSVSTRTEILRTAAEYFLMHEVGLIVQRINRPPIGPVVVTDVPSADYEPIDIDFEAYRMNGRRPPVDWVGELRASYYRDLRGLAGTTPRVLPYFEQIIRRLSQIDGRPVDLLEEQMRFCDCYGVLPGRVIGPLAIELIWSYWHEEGMLAQTLNAIAHASRTGGRGGGRPTRSPGSRSTRCAR